jgi:carbonic anhydrase
VLPTGVAKWIYAEEGSTVANATAQTNTWGGLCVTGHEQSPINVDTKRAIKTALPMINTSFDTTLSYVKNSGHGFQLFETSPTLHKWSSGAAAAHDATQGAKGFSMIGGDKFNFYQVHWHTPSENTIDGISFALEAHFVHQLDDVALVGGYHRLAVIGLMYKMGSMNDCNTFLDYFWSKFPDNKGAAAYSGDNPNFNEKLSLELALGYYHWMGSLTTPPCTEGVSWNLLKSAEKTCQTQVERLKGALASTQYGIAFNNRVTQPLNHRVVTELTAVPQIHEIADNLTASEWKYGIELAAENGMYTQKNDKGLPVGCQKYGRGCKHSRYDYEHPEV